MQCNNQCICRIAIWGGLLSSVVAAGNVILYTLVWQNFCFIIAAIAAFIAWMYFIQSPWAGLSWKEKPLMAPCILVDPVENIYARKHHGDISGYRPVCLCVAMICFLLSVLYLLVGVYAYGAMRLYHIVFEEIYIHEVPQI